MGGFTWGRLVASFALGALGSAAGAALVAFMVADYVVGAYKDGNDAALNSINASISRLEASVNANIDRVVARQDGFDQVRADIADLRVEMGSFADNEMWAALVEDVAETRAMVVLIAARLDIPIRQ